MPSTDRIFPVRMRRIAIVTMDESARDALVALADSGTVDLAGSLGSGEGPALAALRRLEQGVHGAPPVMALLSRSTPDIEELEARGERAPLAGEVELERRRAAAVRHGNFALFVGWAPEPTLEQLAARLRDIGASLIPLRAPRGQQPPTLLAPAPAADPFRPLISTYGAVAYRDVDPTPFVAITYCLMFGMMFGDVGDGLLIVLAALLLRRTRSPRLRRLREVWPLIAAPGVAAILFGLLYGEFFGPTKLLPTLWLDPLNSPTRLLLAAILAGGVLLAVGGVIGIANRWREGGAPLALTSISGVPGLALLIGAAAAVAGAVDHRAALEILGLGLAVVALVPLAVGLRAEAGAGPTAVLEVGIGLFDALVRLLSNVFSFARLAAFALMHAAIAKVVLHAAGSLTGSPIGDLGAVLVFALGWSAAFALEGLVVTVQALRLEYYELFSRLFARAGRPFRPWKMPLLSTEEAR